MKSPELLPVPARYAFARDREAWEGVRTALEPDADGWLTLAPLPGPADGDDVDLPAPYDLGASGIAAGPCGFVFVADTAHDRIVIVDRHCGGKRSWLAAEAPRGLAASDTALAIAESGKARVRTLAFPALDVHAVLQVTSAGALQMPVGVAFDRAGRQYVLDGTLARIFRVDAYGAPDAAYDAALQSQPLLTDPRFLAIDGDDRLLVSDRAAKAVLVFDADGTLSHQLPAPSSTGWTPGAIACAGPRAYVHDTFTGVIHVFTSQPALPAPPAPPAPYVYWCAVPGWRGPVTALAVDANGNLLIKPGLDDAFVVFVANAGHAVAGTMEWGPLDAGKELEWFRAAVDAQLPSRTRATLEVAQLDPPAPPPVASDWIAAPSLDTLLAPLVPAVPPPSRRWLWLRVTLTTNDPRVTPRLRQLRAETPGEDYLDYLPAVYRRTDVDGQLARLLALIKTEQSAVDERVDDMPRVASTSFARTSALPWLAEWVAFELPVLANTAERRALIAGALARHERRGTGRSIRQFVELHTGIRPAIVEAYTTRALWMLGESSRLGFDTALPPANPDGIVVPDSSVTTDEPPRCEPPPIGSAVVGESGPLPRDRFGEPLFSETAHRFHVFVPAHRTRDAALVGEIRRIVEREKPAHTQYCLCVVPPQVSVGFQSQVGVDMIVGRGAPDFRLDDSRLSRAAIGPAGGEGLIGMNTSVGQTTLLT
jgi:phage tail-like protein